MLNLQEPTPYSCRPKHSRDTAVPASAGPSSTSSSRQPDHPIPDHNGDCWSAAARVPLHRSESHCEGADPLNGAPRAGPPRPALRLRLPGALWESGSDLLFQVKGH
ncbi:hypothetical protein RR46_14868 [Papilio xuthus]|uniref:Uncharacterized protein n=1 Tax=Papilio xuthus TaxID=66420 RepID=A0A194PF87_PAPXU|nr:hypothetical protein RR46_14868 [Papilio xuthus]